MYKYIIFDLDDTLFDFKKAEAIAITETLEKFGVKATLKTVKLYSDINISCWKRYEKGEITREEIYENRVNLLGEKLGVTFDVSRFTDEYCRHLSSQGQTYSYSFSLLRQLKARGYKMAAATNGSLSVQTGRIAASGIADFFDSGIYISEKIGFKKPDIEFFQYILNAIGIKDKAEVLIIGDSLSSDIAGANAAGIDSCLVSEKNIDNFEHSPTYFARSLEEIISVCGL